MSKVICIACRGTGEITTGDGLNLTLWKPCPYCHPEEQVIDMSAFEEFWAQVYKCTGMRVGLKEGVLTNITEATDE